jgi:hypothetical protein
VVAAIFIGDNLNIVRLNKEASDYLEELEKIRLSLDDGNRENPDINVAVEITDIDEDGNENKKSSQNMRGI